MSGQNTQSEITVFEVTTHRNTQNRIVLSYKAAMETIAYSLAGSLDIVKRWKGLNEFSGLDTPELAGSFNHRIRYELNKRFTDNDVGEFSITEHHATNVTFPSKSYVRKILPGLEFDPSYELQAALNRVALDEDTARDAGDFLRSVIDLNIRTLERRLSPEQIGAVINDVSQRNGGHDFTQGSKWTAQEFVAALPTLVFDKFNDLAREAFPSQTMKM
jgi:hypothetical protein